MVFNIIWAFCESKAILCFTTHSKRSQNVYVQQLSESTLYKAIKNVFDGDMPYSLTEYITKKIRCPKIDCLDIVALGCITGKCKNNCQIVDLVADLSEEVKKRRNKLVSYYVFESVVTKYFDSTGQEMSTALVDKKETFTEVIQHLQSVSEK